MAEIKIALYGHSSKKRGILWKEQKPQVFQRICKPADAYSQNCEYNIFILFEIKSLHIFSLIIERKMKSF